jgi:hypothetical protein
MGAYIFEMLAPSISMFWRNFGISWTNQHRKKIDGRITDRYFPQNMTPNATQILVQILTFFHSCLLIKLS